MRAAAGQPGQCMIGGIRRFGIDGPTCAAIVARLDRAKGCFAFHPSQEMVLGVTTTVRAALSSADDCTAAQQAIDLGRPTPGTAETRHLPVAAQVYAHLYGESGLTVGKEPKGDSRNLNEEPNPLWAWPVTPVVRPPQGGTLILRLETGVTVTLPDGRQQDFGNDPIIKQIRVKLAILPRPPEQPNSWFSWIVAVAGIVVAALTALLAKTTDLVKAWQKLVGLLRRKPDAGKDPPAG